MNYPSKGMKYYIDIDDTICRPHRDASSTEEKYMKATPIVERIERVNQLYEAGNTITYWTARGGESGIDFEALTRPLSRFGVKWSLADNTLHIPARQRLRTAYDLGDAIPKIEDGPWPAFPSDLMSVLIVLATQTRGSTLFFEKMFESRLYFVDHLIGMGARIVQCDPHRVVVTGATALRGSRVASPDIRAGMALLIAALCARGETVIHNAESIDRGYERVDEELRRLGAAITRDVE
jgi:UDP-N-acetylglucosamine 1-carboxyvinyltransferase